MPRKKLDILDVGVSFSIEEWFDIPASEAIVREFVGEVKAIAIAPEDEDSQVFNDIGNITGTILDVGIVLDSNADLFEVADSHSQGLCAVFETLFDPDTDELKDSVAESSCGGMGGYVNTVLIINSVEIDHKFRGQQAGLKAIEIAIRSFTNGSTLVVLEPCPLGDIQSEDIREFVKRKLICHYKKLGFVEVPGSVFMVRYTDINPHLSGDLNPYANL